MLCSCRVSSGNLLYGTSEQSLEKDQRGGGVLPEKSDRVWPASLTKDSLFMTIAAGTVALNKVYKWLLLTVLKLTQFYDENGQN